jgi:hypothetical protein
MLSIVCFVSVVAIADLRSFCSVNAIYMPQVSCRS